MEMSKDPVENVIALWIAESRGYADFSAWEVQGACELLDRLDEAGYEVWSKSLPACGLSDKQYHPVSSAARQAWIDGYSEEECREIDREQEIEPLCAYCLEPGHGKVDCPERADRMADRLAEMLDREHRKNQAS